MVQKENSRSDYGWTQVQGPKENARNTRSAEVTAAAQTFHRGNSRAALSYKLFPFVAGPIGSALNFSMFPLISGTPGPGQSVPHNTLSATSSIRGKYSISFCGGMPEISMYMFLCRRTRKNASFIHSGLPPCARMTTRFG